MEKSRQELQNEQNHVIVYRLAILFCSFLEQTKKPIPEFAVGWWALTKRLIQDRRKSKEDVTDEIHKRQKAALAKLNNDDRLALGLPPLKNEEYIPFKDGQ